MSLNSWLLFGTCCYLLISKDCLYFVLSFVKPGSHWHIREDTTIYDLKVLVSHVKCRDCRITTPGNSWEVSVSLHKSS